MRLSPWLLLFSSAVLTSADNRNEREFTHDGWVEEEEYEIENINSPEPVYGSRCCTDADPADLLVVSTMDGKVQAVDVQNGGRLVWQSDLDGAALMGGNLGKMGPLTAEGDQFVLVPSLDGSLYMFSMEERVLEPIPLSTDMLLHSVRIGKEAVAGGKSISTTGVDPVTGKIRYHCTSAHCEQSQSDREPTSTLVFKRVSHNIRAVDALNGAEKWNLSVSEYDATLVRKKTTLNGSHSKSDMKFIISPPKGTITAVSSCGEAKWTISLGVHIARSWHLDGYDLNEVSIFDSNIHSISNLQENEHSLIRPESLFYLGTIDNDPFILCSEKLRSEMRRVSNQLEAYDQTNKRIDANSRALVKAGGESYQVADGVLEEVLGRAFKQSISRLNERRIVRQIAGSHDNEDNDGMRIALPSPDQVNSGSMNSCEVSDDGVIMIGEDNIRNAEPSGDSRGDQGWFILRPSTSPKRLGFLAPPAQCTAQFMKKSLHLENDVNPLWRLLAIFLLFVTGVIGMFKFAKIRRHWREARAVVDGIAQEDVRVDLQSISAPLKTESPDPPAAVRKTASDDILDADAVKKEERAIDAASRIRNLSTRSGSNSSNSDTFQSTFLRDYDPVKVLGRGGFGVVFEARNKLDCCHYAVKRIAVDNNERAIERVLREVRAMAMLDHKGIIRYCTTWLERPPEGWQKETDKQMLAQISAKKHGLVEVIESSSSNSLSERNSGNTSHIDFVAPPVAFNREDEEESWADSSRKEEEDEISSSEEESSNDSSSDTSGFENSTHNVKLNRHQESSDGIIFYHVSKEFKHRNSQLSVEISQLTTDLALVTSIDEELLPSRNTLSNVYLYIQMQLCQDATLYSWLLRNKRAESREPEKMKRWFKQLVDAVLYIHDKGLIHRDIKPQNIFVFGDLDVVKIGDLGLVSKGAGEVEDEETKRRSSSSLHTDNVGTRTYMSPEQLAGAQYTSKVDVFSLGLIFTELNVPFSTLMERSKVLSGLQSGIQPEELQNRPLLADFIAWLTKTSPDKRPTCKEISTSEFLKNMN